jgi:hypothetical protein
MICDRLHYNPLDTRIRGMQSDEQNAAVAI